jgi:hypothetical protein
MRKTLPISLFNTHEIPYYSFPILFLKTQLRMYLGHEVISTAAASSTVTIFGGGLKLLTKNNLLWQSAEQKA